MVPNRKKTETFRQWGDFQTPMPLAREVCTYLRSIGCNPEIVIEPTCGEGNLLQAALETFPEFQMAYGTEVQPAYATQARHRFLDLGLAGKVVIEQADFFTHQFPVSVCQNTSSEVLIIGNPPWVTNAEMMTLEVQNLPEKHNFKGHSGLDAKTGKANFDISENMILKLLDTFGNHTGRLALLCKNAVIRNLIQDLPRRQFRVSEIHALGINAKRHFDANVDASLLVIRLGAKEAEGQCTLFDSMANRQVLSTFGWTHGKFVSRVESYPPFIDLDGESPLVWRQGLKHDCSKVMELTCKDGLYQNAMGESIELEPETIFPLLKSSDLKTFETHAARLCVPVTQRRLGEATDWIEHQSPKLWQYLQAHRDQFETRRSSIYRGRPCFSVFGIGGYAFSPYKVAISGMYKTGIFTLVEPINGQPVMVDDTCYFLGFDSYLEALLVGSALNSELVRGFLASVVFFDAKRPFTKDLLKRIDLEAVFRRLTYADMEAVWRRFQYTPRYPLNKQAYDQHVGKLFT